MFVVPFCGGSDAVRKHLPGFAVAGFASKELAVHQISRNVIGMALEERSKMGVGGGEVAAVHALESKAVAREGVIRLFRDELFERLAAGFLLFRHWVVSYYTDTRGGVQNCAGAGDSNEAKKRKHARA